MVQSIWISHGTERHNDMATRLISMSISRYNGIVDERRSFLHTWMHHTVGYCTKMNERQWKCSTWTWRMGSYRTYNLGLLQLAPEQVVSLFIVVINVGAEPREPIVEGCIQHFLNVRHIYESHGFLQHNQINLLRSVSNCPFISRLSTALTPSKSQSRKCTAQT
jgi:hypothetical protein